MESRTVRAELTAKENEINGHRVFHLQRPASKQGKPLRFVTFGCQGSGSQYQRAVALQLSQLCANPETRPDFILILGDNLYEWGANDADDPAFKTYFDDMYLNLPHLADIPFFLIPGNHDENLQNELIAKHVKERGIPRIMHQVAHSLMPDNKFNADQKEEIYRQPAFKLDAMPSWNMPRRYYSLIDGDTQIFCIDSNTYVKDFMDYHDNPKSRNADNNQAAWLEHEIEAARSAGRKIILAEHHPLYTPGKRAYERTAHNDLGIYLDKADIIRLQKILKMPAANEETPYNACLTECYRRQMLHFDLITAAHDHDIYYYNNADNHKEDYRICQLTSGGGGGKLHERTKFSEQADMGCFLKQHGFAIITHETGEPDFNILIHTTDHKHQLEFTTRNHAAIIHFTPQYENRELAEAFLAVVEDALNEYLSFMGEKQNESQGRFFSANIFGGNLTHGHKGAERAHQLWAYIKHPYPKSLPHLAYDVFELTKRDEYATPAADHSLITILNQHMMKKYGKYIDKFANDLIKSSRNSAQQINY